MNSGGTIQISADALKHNIEQLRSLCTHGQEIVAVVKANAYGHGLSHIVDKLERHVDAFQVDDLDELASLRRHSFKRVFLLGYVPTKSIDYALSEGCELAVYDLSQVGAIAEAAKRQRKQAWIHLKIDALLGRLGILPSSLDEVIDAVEAHPNIVVAGAYAHYANIEDTNDPSHSLVQEEVFNFCFNKIHARFPKAKRHMSATSGLMAREESSPNDFVRLGIGLYGLYPSDALASTFASLNLWPVMRWVSQLAQVKTLPADHPVSYGLTYVTSKPTRIGVVPQGYSDGFDRGLSNCGCVLVGGKRCPVVGRVAMNMFMVDLTSVPEAQMGDEVVILGDQGEETISAEEMAGLIGTINYEVVARISPHLRRELV